MHIMKASQTKCSHTHTRTHTHTRVSAIPGAQLHRYMTIDNWLWRAPAPVEKPLQCRDEGYKCMEATCAVMPGARMRRKESEESILMCLARKRTAVWRCFGTFAGATVNTKRCSLRSCMNAQTMVTRIMWTNKQHVFLTSGTTPRSTRLWQQRARGKLGVLLTAQVSRSTSFLRSNTSPSSRAQSEHASRGFADGMQIWCWCSHDAHRARPRARAAS